MFKYFLQGGKTVADLLFEDGYRVQKVLDAMRQLAAEGRKVRV